MAKIEIKDLYKTYDNKKNILKKINLKIDHGEFVDSQNLFSCIKEESLWEM